MNDARPPAVQRRRKVVRRRRRERQIIVFGVAAIVLVAVGIAAAAVFRGDAEGPFDAAFHTPAGEFESDVTLVCPPRAKPLEYSKVVVRVNNATGESGLAGATAQTLEGRGFVISSTSNWSVDYEDYVKIQFGEDGVRHAYTLATQFPEAELVLDNREGITLDLVLGDDYAADPGLRELLSPELDPDLQLAAQGECLPVDLVAAELAPRTLPENPLEAEPSTSPSPSASPSGE